MLLIPRTSISVPGRAMETRATRCAAAWLAEMLTVELHGALVVTRRAERPGDLLGDWFAIGDTSTDAASFATRHAVPPRGNAMRPDLRHGAVWRLQPGSVLNVGLCAPLFGLPGGGCQAEFLEGPLPIAERDA